MILWGLLNLLRVGSKKAITWEFLLVILIAVLVGVLFFVVVFKGLFLGTTGSVEQFASEQL